MITPTTRKFFLLAALLVGFAPTSIGASGLYVNISSGLPILKLDLGGGYTPSLGAVSYFDIEVSRSLHSLPLTVGVFTEGFLGGSYGKIPLMITGLSISYFPFDAPARVVNQDSPFEGTRLVQRRISLYVNTRVGLSFLVLREKSGALVQVGSSGFAYQVGSGVDFPFGGSFAAGPSLNFMTTLANHDFTDNPVTVSGYLLGGRFVWNLD